MSLHNAAPVCGCDLFSLFLQHRRRILVAYVLMNLENVAQLVQPLALGIAVDQLFDNRLDGIGYFLLLQLVNIALTTLRRIYDTRAFNHIYGAIATQTVRQQKSSQVSFSLITARSALSRSYVEFFQQQLPVLVQSAYCSIGALAVLWFYDPTLTLVCLTATLPILFLGNRFYKITNPLNRGLHDELEREVDVIRSEHEDELPAHFHSLASWRIKLADAESLNFAVVDLLLLSLVGLSLIHACWFLTLSAGDVIAITRYVTLFTMGLDAIPLSVQQVSKLRDIQSRLKEPLTVIEERIDCSDVGRLLNVSSSSCVS